MGLSNIICGEDSKEGSSACCCFDVGATTLFAVYQTEDSNHIEACRTGSFDGHDGGSPGGAYVIDDNDLSSTAIEALETLPGAVRFFGFSDKKTVEQFRVGELKSVPGARAGCVGDERVCAHGEASDSLGSWPVLAYEFVENETGEASALRMEGRRAAVDVVVTAGSTREHEIA